jgi:hypothetical protein
MLKNLIYTKRGNFLTMQDKKTVKNKMIKCKETVTKISVQSEHFSVLVVTGLTINQLNFITIATYGYALPPSGVAL